MKDPREVGRDAAAQMGKEALAVCRAGRYTAPDGTPVELAPAIARAREGTRSFPPEAAIPRPVAGGAPARIVVRNESTLAAARRLHRAGLDPVALNFASARSPGGGFLRGARAQEESLCRASALYECLEGQEMYARHAALRDPLYTSWLLYSPAVPVFRGDEGALLAEPWPCAFITAPAPNGKALAPQRRGELDAAIGERVDRVLAAAALGGHRGVVLGAWGCGAFGCDPDVVAGRFADALAGPYRGAFVEVVFAILDTSPERRFIGPFERRLGR